MQIQPLHRRPEAFDCLSRKFENRGIEDRSVLPFQKSDIRDFRWADNVGLWEFTAYDGANMLFLFEMLINGGEDSWDHDRGDAEFFDLLALRDDFRFYDWGFFRPINVQTYILIRDNTSKLKGYMPPETKQ